MQMKLSLPRHPQPTTDALRGRHHIDRRWLCARVARRRALAHLRQRQPLHLFGSAMQRPVPLLRRRAATPLARHQPERPEAHRARRWPLFPTPRTRPGACSLTTLPFRLDYRRRTQQRPSIAAHPRHARARKRTQTHDDHQRQRSP